VPERILIKIAVLTYPSLNASAPSYTSLYFTHVAVVPSWLYLVDARLSSASSNRRQTGISRFLRLCMELVIQVPTSSLHSPSSDNVRKLFRFVAHIRTYSVSQKNPHGVFWHFFPKRLGIFRSNFTRPLYVPIYAILQIFIQLSAIWRSYANITRDHPVHIIKLCAKCSPLAKTHAGIFCHFYQTVGNF